MPDEKHVFIYENHLGQRFDGTNCVYLNQSDLRDYSWNYDTINNRVSRFYRGVTSRNIPLVVYAKSKAEANAAKNRLCDITEVDIAETNNGKATPGKVFVGDYYTLGWIVSSKKTAYMPNPKYTRLGLELLRDDSAWYRDTLHTFAPARNSPADNGAGYPYGFPYDYTNPANTRNIMCESVGGNAFRLLIYGRADNPTVYIGGHTYAINGTINSGETLLIDSLNKTITLTTATGKKENWYARRNRASYIFEPIPAGQNTVNWDGSFGFDLTVIEKRSEPRWI